MKTRIGVLGLGGVGGYFGGLLAGKYNNSQNVEVIFIARPETEKVIKEQGLKLITPEKEQVVYPDLIASAINSIGTLDVLIVAVKSYDLITSVINIAPSIDKNTIILPLLNGVDAKDKISKVYPDNLVLDGCVFVISKIIERGVIERIAGKGVLYFGATKENERLKALHHIFLEAGINAKYASNILEVVWGKYLFIASLASLTSYLDITTGQIFENEKHKDLLIQLLEEFQAVANAKQIPLSKTIIEETVQKIEALPYETTTSMQRDFQQNRKTEYKSLTKHIVDLGNESEVEVPTFELILKELDRKGNS